MKSEKYSRGEMFIVIITRVLSSALLLHLRKPLFHHSPTCKQSDNLSKYFSLPFPQHSALTYRRPRTETLHRRMMQEPSSTHEGGITASDIFWVPPCRTRGERKGEMAKMKKGKQRI